MIRTATCWLFNCQDMYSYPHCCLLYCNCICDYRVGCKNAMVRGANHQNTGNKLFYVCVFKLYMVGVKGTLFLEFDYFPLHSSPFSLSLFLHPTSLSSILSHFLSIFVPCPLPHTSQRWSMIRFWKCFGSMCLHHQALESWFSSTFTTSCLYLSRCQLWKLWQLFYVYRILKIL